MRADPRAALRDAVGEAGLEEHAPVDVDGAAVALTLRPPDGEALAGTLAAVGRSGLAVLVRGGGSRAGLGNPPRRADAFLSTERLRGVDDFDPSEGVCHARAGTPLAEVREAVRAGGWELPLDPPGASATVGGCVAAAALGPRALGFGRPRDVVLGLEVTLATGERTRCGGRVVKNVTGYDLTKLYTGSCGALGVIEAAWLRLRPRPERELELEAAFDDLGTACDGVREAGRRSSARVAALSSAPRGWLAVFELAGDAPSVERDAAWLAGRLGAGETGGGAVARLRARQAELGAPAGLRFRVAVLPARLAAALETLLGRGAEIVAYPGLGTVFAGFPLTETRAEQEGETASGGDRAARAFAAVAELARAFGGGYLCEAAPTRVKAGRDVFGESPAVLPLFRALKQRFDPEGVLNPGRFAGGL